MQMAGVLVALLALSAGPWQCSAARSTAALATSADGVQTPLTRVVKLLQGLALKTKMEGQMEEELYEKFVCWGKSIIDTKTASNAAAQARIESLEDYIKDIEAGRITFTTEEADLTKEIYTLGKDIDTSTDLRAQEHGQFLEAEDEMEKAIAALTKAINVLQAATDGHETGTLLVQRAGDRMGEGFAARAADAAALQHAVEIGQRALSAGDAVFLRRLLTADVPKRADWKDLNKKATFRVSYKARSFKIQGTLTKLNETFTANLAEARKKEADSKALYDKLIEDKTAQKTQAEEAKDKLVVENGARGLNKEQAQDEVDNLKLQVANDQKFIKQTQDQLAEKKAEWKVRYTLRENEIAAMQKAVAILYNDDARDLMRRSFKSQGYSLLQETSVQKANSHATEQRVRSAAEVLRKAASAGSDARLAALASRLSFVPGDFKEVSKAIDDMVSLLKQEEVDDLTKKENCEKERADDTRSAAMKSRKMDDATDLMTRLTQEAEDLGVEIKEKSKTVAEIEAALAEATAIREAETKEWMVNDKDDRDMAETVLKAREVLDTFYKENNLMFVQQPEQVPAGEAPLPPPKTWEGGYQGKTDQATGILAVLDMIHEDVVKDLDLAKAAEDKAAAKYVTFKTESETEIGELNKAVSDLEGEKAEKEEAVSELKSGRLVTKEELDAIMQTIRDTAPGCEYFTINYPTRLRNRQIEMDGLRKAKAILAGGDFTVPDPNRELVPGDALLQHRRQ